jgi:hypothetical protein
MKKERYIIAIVFSVAALFGTMTIGDRTFTGFLDASGASWTRPAKSGTALPGTCNVGEQYFKTDATAGQNLFLCTAANTWTQITGGGGGGSSVPDCTLATSICIYEDFADNSGTISDADGKTRFGTHGWQLAWAASQSRIASVAGHPGIRRLSTGAGNGDMANAMLNGDSESLIALSGTWTLSGAARLSRTTSIGQMTGLDSQHYFAYGSGHRVGLRYDTGQSDSTYKYIVCSLGTCAVADTGAAPSTAFRRFTCAGSASQISCSLYNESGALISGSAKTFCAAASGCDVNSVAFPTGAMSPYFGLISRTGTAAYQEVDYWSYTATGVGR